jgi:hypothetical protein
MLFGAKRLRASAAGRRLLTMLEARFKPFTVGGMVVLPPMYTNIQKTICYFLANSPALVKKKETEK